MTIGTGTCIALKGNLGIKQRRNVKQENMIVIPRL
jgi:hypothetical protein